MDSVTFAKKCKLGNLIKSEFSLVWVILQFSNSIQIIYWPSDFNNAVELVSPPANWISFCRFFFPVVVLNWICKQLLPIVLWYPTDLFMGQLKSTLRCLHCGHTSVTFDPFWDLSLTIPRTSSSHQYTTSYGSVCCLVSVHTGQLIACKLYV